MWSLRAIGICSFSCVIRLSRARRVRWQPICLYLINKSLVSPQMSLSQTVEQHFGQESEVYPDCPGFLLMHLLAIELESSTLHCIATCTLILHHGRTLHSSSCPINWNTPTDRSCVRVACVRPHHAFIGDYPFAFDAFAWSGRPLTPVLCYGDVQLPEERSRRLGQQSGRRGLRLSDDVRRGSLTNSWRFVHR